jgi:hypothetical protein
MDAAKKTQAKNAVQTEEEKRRGARASVATAASTATPILGSTGATPTLGSTGDLPGSATSGGRGCRTRRS